MPRIEGEPGQALNGVWVYLKEQDDPEWHTRIGQAPGPEVSIAVERSHGLLDSPGLIMRDGTVQLRCATDGCVACCCWPRLLSVIERIPAYVALTSTHHADWPAFSQSASAFEQ